MTDLSHAERFLEGDYEVDLSWEEAELVLALYMAEPELDEED